MMGWHTRPFAVVDFESTGVDTETARVVTAAVGVVQPESHAVDLRMWLVDPGIEIPEGAAKIHGVTTEMARASGAETGVAIGEILGVLHQCLQADLPLVIYNAPYDLTLLDREARRNDHPALTDLLDGCSLWVIDPLVIERHFGKRGMSNTLVNAAQRYGIPLPGDAHNAGVDAFMAAQVAIAQANAHPEIAMMSLPDLQRWQASTHAGWASSMRQYFYRSGQRERAAGCSSDWPMVPFRG